MPQNRFIALLTAEPCQVGATPVLVGKGLFHKLIAVEPHLLEELWSGWGRGQTSFVYQLENRPLRCKIYVDERSGAPPVDLIVEGIWDAEHQESLPGLDGVQQNLPAAIAIVHEREGRWFYGATNKAFNKLVNQNVAEGCEFGSLYANQVSKLGEIKTLILKSLEAGQRLHLSQIPLNLDWLNDSRDGVKYFDIACEPISAPVGATRSVMLYGYDVTSSVRARSLAERKVNFFQTLVDSLPQIVWTADHTGAIDWYNQRWYDFRGISKNDPQAYQYDDLLHPDDRAAIYNQWSQASSTGDDFASEIRLRDQQGCYHWFLVQVRSFCDKETGERRWFGTSTDVHEQKASAQAMSSLLENMNEGFFVVDGQWKILHVNKKHTALTKISREQQIGRTLQDVFFSGVDPRKSQYLINCERAIKERVTLCFDEYYAPLNMWIAVSLYPTGEDGLAIIYHNLSAERALQKHVEIEKQKFEALFVHSPALMALLRGPNFVYEKVNERYSAIMGHRQLIGVTMMDAAPEMKGQPFEQLMKDVYRTGVPYVARSMAADLTDPGTQHARRSFFDFTYSRVNDPLGRPYGIYLHAFDVTDKVAASKRADELAASLTKAILARDEFLSSASHELKTPVTSIKMQLQMTRRHVNSDKGFVPDAKKLARTMDICVRQVDRLAALIEDLLDVSRIAAGKMTFNHSPAAISKLVEQTVLQFDEQFKAAACDLRLNVAPGLQIECDVFRIEQVLVNLITNALKYGPGAPIDIAAEALDDGGVRISVADRGIGIAEELHTKVFERFERAVSHDHIAGLGLGLFICKQIVDAHGGAIHVSSRNPNGSVFVVDLPRIPRRSSAGKDS